MGSSSGRRLFEMLRLFAANPAGSLASRELMEMLWPNVHIGGDSLCQCIRDFAPRRATIRDR